jgi:hypothetical protein
MHQKDMISDPLQLTCFSEKERVSIVEGVFFTHRQGP